MITNKNPRRYEISLWTLQDSFITVLKSFNLDNFGTIENPQMDLSDDSEDTFSFRLPMYIRVDGEYKENPIWYNVLNGNLIINLRKIKVIFHKGEPKQRIFEFVITKITESHEGFEKYCDVECEGLAYNELGKTGHNIELSQELYEEEYKDGIKYNNDSLFIYKDDNDQPYIILSNRTDYIEELNIINTENKQTIEYSDIIYNENTYQVKVILNNIEENCTKCLASYTYIPLNNINYWLDKVIPEQFGWSYRINMNWNSYYDENRDSDKIYEDAYIENWDFNENENLFPTSIINSKEKFRIVTESNSNRYNLTQTIAQTFNVYCRYIYEYDDNLHITNRIVEFYNSALKEDEDVLDFTYYYDTESISREMDSADQVSKMFVLDSSSDNMLTNSITIVDGNKTLENYLLNFEYLYKTGAIDDEQKEYLNEFESIIRQYNLDLRKLADKITQCSNALEGTDGFRVKRDSAQIAAQQAQEALDNEQSYVRHLLKSDKTDYDRDPETLSITGLDADCTVIVQDDNGVKYCKIHKEGVLPNSIIVFTTMSAAYDYHKAIFGEDEERKLQIKINEVTVDGQVKYTAQVKDNSNSFVNITDDNGQDVFDNYNQAYNAGSQWLLTNKIKDSMSLNNYQVVIDPKTNFATGLTNITCDDEITAFYLIYNYNLELYHKKLAEQYKQLQYECEQQYEDYAKIVDKIDGKRDDNGEWISEDHGLLQKYLDEYDELLKIKDKKILEFENYLGAAVREGTWTPDDDYAKYGDRHSILLNLQSNTQFSDEGVSIGWDNCIFTKEKRNYDEYGVNREKVYYPCIKLTSNIQKNIYDALNNDQQIDIQDIGFVWDDTVVPGINRLIEPEMALSDEEIERLKNRWIEIRNALEQKDNVTQAEKELLAEAEKKYRNALNSQKVPVDYPQIYRIGSEAELAFLRLKDEPDSSVIPVLMLINADSYCSTYDIINQTGASQTDILKTLNGKIGTIDIEEAQFNNTDDIHYEYLVNIISEEELQWIEDQDLENYERVYPRIRIPYATFVENNDDCKIFINNDTQLDSFQDYDIKNRYDLNEGIEITDLSFWLSDKELEEVNFAYYITLSPEMMIRNNFQYGEYQLFYKLSNTALAIYLDAIEILKENSIPKVTYNITPIILKTSFMEEAYKEIHRIININDPELKFEDVQGYIYSMSLNLDAPWNDTIEVKNYKTKFEDLFSSIVASTIQIQKNSLTLSAAASAFSTTGELTQETLQKSISAADLTFKFNNDNFIIDNTGIKAISDNGIVHYTDQGIFTATEKDENNNWKWNTSILPSGISANSITTGQLDTNLIRIYSGDNLRFQMNSDGLFAYKSWFNEDISKLSEEERETINDEIIRRDGLDDSQFLVLNSDGLFLTAKKGSYIFDRDTNNYNIVEKDVNRVEISWNGLILRDNNNKETFYADPDTGDLNIVGNISINGNNISAELTNSKLQFGAFQLVKTNTNNSECLSFIYELGGE